MAVTVVLSGIPHYVTLEDLAYQLDKLFNSDEIGSFGVQDMSSDPWVKKRQVLINFNSGFDAMVAQELLHGYKYELDNGKSYVLCAKIKRLSSSEVVNNPSLVNVQRRKIYSASNDCNYDTKTNCLVPFSGIEHVIKANSMLDAKLSFWKKKEEIIKTQRSLIHEKRKLKKECIQYIKNIPLSDDESRSSSWSCQGSSRSRQDRSRSRQRRSSSRQVRSRSRQGRSRSRQVRSRSRQGRSGSRKCRSGSRKCRSRSRYRRSKSRQVRSRSRRSRSRSNHGRSRSRHRRSRSRRRRSKSRQVRSRSRRGRLRSRHRRSRSRRRRSRSRRGRSRSRQGRSRSRHRRSRSKKRRRRHTYRRRRRSSSTSSRESYRRSTTREDRRLLPLTTSEIVSVDRSPTKQRENIEAESPLTSETRKQSPDEIKEKERSLIEEVKQDITAEMKAVFQDHFQIKNYDKHLVLEEIRKLLEERLKRLLPELSVSGMSITEITNYYRSIYKKQDDKNAIRTILINSAIGYVVSDSNEIIDTKLPEIDTNLPEIDTKLPKIDTKLPEIDTKLPEIDTKLPKINTKQPKIDKKLPKINTKLPKIYIKLPKKDTNISKIDTNLPKIDTKLPEKDTKLPKIDTKLPEEDTKLPEEDTKLPDTECDDKEKQLDLDRKLFEAKTIILFDVDVCILREFTKDITQDQKNFVLKQFSDLLQDRLKKIIEHNQSGSVEDIVKEYKKLYSFMESKIFVEKKINDNHESGIVVEIPDGTSKENSFLSKPMEQDDRDSDIWSEIDDLLQDIHQYEKMSGNTAKTTEGHSITSVTNNGTLENVMPDPVSVSPMENLKPKMKDDLKIECGIDLDDEATKSKVDRAVKVKMKQRLCIVLTGNNYKCTDDILKMYRDVYPEERDGEFLNEIFQEVKAGVYDNIEE